MWCPARAGRGAAMSASILTQEQRARIEAQRQHIAQLRERLGMLEKQRAAARPMSRERLPPMQQPAGGDMMHG